MKTWVRHYKIQMFATEAQFAYESFRPKSDELDEFAKLLEQTAKELGARVASITPVQGALVSPKTIWNHWQVSSEMTCGFIVVFESADDCELPDTRPKI